MSRLQDLHPDQQAVLQLVLRRRMPYGDLAGLLDLTPEGVRERALDAIDGLAPDDVAGLALEDRDRIADHLLGQDEGVHRDATEALIAEHPPAATWAAIVAAELEALGGPVALPAPSPTELAGRPPHAVESAGPPPPRASPAGEPPIPGATPAAPSAGVGARSTSPGAGRGPTTGRRNPLAGASPRVLAGSAVAAVIVLILVLWVAGAFSGDDEATSASGDAPPVTTAAGGASAPAGPPTAEERAAAAQFVAALPDRIPFRAPSSATGAFADVTGTATPAVSAANAAFPVLRLTIRGMPPLTAERRYFAWADKNGADPIFLGQLTENTGAELPFRGLDLETREAAVVDPTVYNRVRVTREGTEPPTEPGPTVIVGTIAPSGS